PSHRNYRGRRIRSAFAQALAHHRQPVPRADLSHRFDLQGARTWAAHWLPAAAAAWRGARRRSGTHDRLDARAAVDADHDALDRGWHGEHDPRGPARRASGPSGARARVAARGIAEERPGVHVRLVARAGAVALGRLRCERIGAWRQYDAGFGV